MKVKISDVLDELTQLSDDIYKCKGLTKEFRHAKAEGIREAIMFVRERTQIELEP